ncbi:MAG: LppP/LprE family lipoprotein [bacterium]
MIRGERRRVQMQVGVVGAALAITVVLGAAEFASAQSSPAPRSWLDKATTMRNGAQNAAWNRAGAPVPPVPRRDGAASAADAVRCRETARRPMLAPDRAVSEAGWTLFGAAQVYGRTTVVKARSAVDGMCRPLGYQVFVFHDGKFAGTLSPIPMDARTDGAETIVRVLSEEEIVAEFARYAPDDALCCPSATSRVTYTIERTGDAARVLATEAVTERADAAAASGEETDSPLPPPDTAWGKIAGTIVLGEGIEAPPDAILRITVRNLSQPDNRDAVVAERVLACCDEGRTRFELEYDPLLIEDEDEYAIFARVTVGSELILSTGFPERVISGGRPRRVDLVLARVPR